MALSPKTRLLTGLGVLLALGFGAGAWLRWRHDTLPAVDVAPWIPVDAEALVWTHRLDTVTRSVRQLTRQVPGLEGVGEASKLLVGVDLTDAEAVAASGLQPQSGLAVFRFGGALWAVIPLEDSRGALQIHDLLTKRGFTVVPGQPVTRVMDRTDVKREVAQLREDRGVLLVRWAMDDKVADPDAYENAPKLTKLPSPPGEVHARMQVRADGPEIASLHAAVGPANLVLGGMIDRVTMVEADLVLATAQPYVHVKMTGAPGAFQDVADFHTRFVPDAPGASLDLGSVLPDETPLLVRAKVNPALLEMVPVAIRDAYLPPTVLGGWHPALNGVDFGRSVRDVLDGEVAAGLLAVADDFPLDPSLWLSRSLRKDLRFFVAASCKTDTDAANLLGLVKTALETGADKPSVVQFGDWAGIAVPVADMPWWLLRSGRHLLVVSGRGEGEDLARTASGKFPSLDKAVGDGPAREVLTGRGRWFGALVEFPRIVRALRRRGVPTYALELLGALRSVSAGVGLTGDGIDLVLSLQPTRGIVGTSPAVQVPVAATVEAKP